MSNACHGANKARYITCSEFGEQRHGITRERTLEGNQVDYDILERDIRLWFSLWQILWNKGRISGVCKCKLCRRFRQKEVLGWLHVYGEWLSNKLESHALVSGCTLNYRGLIYNSYRGCKRNLVATRVVG